MSPLLILIAASALGVEVGWEPLPEGGYEYSIQLEPDLCDLLRRGTDEITSEVPPHVNVRRYKMFVGTGKLPRVDGPAEPAAAPAAPQLPRESGSHKSADAPPADGHSEPADRSMAVESQRQTADHPDLEFAPPFRQAPAGAAAEHSDAPEPAHSADRPAPLSAEDERATPLESASFAEPADGGPNKKGTPGKHGEGAAAAAEHGAAKKSGDHAGSDKGGANKTGSANDEVPNGDAAAAAEEPRPWLPFSIALMLLACSLGGNVYLAWIAWEARGRYRETVAKLRAAPAG